MTKNRKKHRQQPKFPWLPVALGGILLLIAAVFFVSRGGGGGGTPKIAVDQRQIDYGTVKFNEPKTFTIRVTNVGDGTLRFQEQPYIEVLEGC